jgi:predicted kinase
MLQQPKLMILCGLPASGKSTHADRLRKEGWSIVCPDDLRKVLHGEPFRPEAEPMVWASPRRWRQRSLPGVTTW